MWFYYSLLVVSYTTPHEMTFLLKKKTDKSISSIKSDNEAV